MKVWTFLFTDIEGSTVLFERAGPIYRAAAERHFDLLREEVQAHGGDIFRNTGDGLLVAFDSSDAAISCARACQQALAREEWPATLGPLRVRMGLHRGEAERAVDDFHGLTMHHATRVLDSGHGGQVVCSASVREHASDDHREHMWDLGAYRLRGLSGPVRLFQVAWEGMPSTGFPPLRTPAAFTHRLPATPTRFFGRESERHELVRLLAPEPPARIRRRHGRLVTLLGPGGTGKTRLSLALAEDMLPAYSHAVWFVALAELRDAVLLPEALRDGLGIPPEPEAIAFDQVQALLSAQPSLLILDNFEQLVPDGAETVRMLLEAAPDLVCLVSSRVRLELSAEQEFVVAPLLLPPASGTPAELLNYASVQLYCDRARAARRQFELTDQNASDVAAVCRTLEGIPLAIELAAARSAVLSPRETLSRLAHRLDFLVGGKKDFAQRHRTLRAAVAWSYELLTPRLQTAFAQLSVFAGGWTYEAGSAVLEDDGTEALAELRGCSLIIAESRDEETRFRMLEVIREFASERLAASGEFDAVTARHRRYFLALASDESGLTESQQLAALEADCDNLRTVLAGGGPSLDRVSLAIDLYPFWMQRGHVREGREWLRRLALEAGDTPRAASFANAAGVLAWKCGDHDEARTHLEQALAISERENKEANVAGLLNNLGILANEQRQFATAKSFYERSLEIYRRLGLRAELGAALSNLGHNQLDLGPAEAARPWLLEALEIQRALGQEFFCANTLHNLAEADLHAGNPDGARRRLAECLRLRALLGTDHDAPIAFCTLASIAMAEGEPARAAALLAAAETSLERLDQKPGPLVCEWLERDAARVRDSLDAAELARSHRIGRSWRLESVLTPLGEWAIALDTAPAEAQNPKV